MKKYLFGLLFLPGLMFSNETEKIGISKQYYINQIEYMDRYLGDLINEKRVTRENIIPLYYKMGSLITEYYQLKSTE